MRLVIIESPFAGNTERNTAYARAALRDCIERGESPLASHMLYTQEGVLDDSNPLQRSLGIQCGLEWATKADATVVYDDLGVSSGMQAGISHAGLLGRPVEYRKIAGWS